MATAWSSPVTLKVVTMATSSAANDDNIVTMTNLSISRVAIPDSKVHGANMGLIWGRQDPSGPHVGPMNFAIWDGYETLEWLKKMELQFCACYVLWPFGVISCHNCLKIIWI